MEGICREKKKRLQVNMCVPAGGQSEGADTTHRRKKMARKKRKKEKVSTGWARTMPLVVVGHLLHVVKRPTVVTGVRDRLPLQQATGVT